MKYHPRFKAIALKKLTQFSDGKFTAQVTYDEYCYLLHIGLLTIEPPESLLYHTFSGQKLPGAFVAWKWFKGKCMLCTLEAKNEKVLQKILRWKKDIEQAEATRRANYQALAHRRSRSEKQGGSVD